MSEATEKTAAVKDVVRDACFAVQNHGFWSRTGQERYKAAIEAVGALGTDLAVADSLTRLGVAFKKKLDEVLSGAPDEKTYRITVDIPADLPDELREALVEAVADAVHDWEPKDREGWDADVSGFDREHSVEAAFDRTFDRNEKAHEIAQEMLGQLQTGPERADVERIIAALEGRDV